MSRLGVRVTSLGPKGPETAMVSGPFSLSAAALGAEGAAVGLGLVEGGLVLHVDMRGGAAASAVAVVLAVLHVAAHALDAAVQLALAHVLFLRYREIPAGTRTGI